MTANYIVQENTKLNLEEIRQHKTNLLSKPFQFCIDLTGRCNINPPCVFCSLKSDGYQYNALDISAVDAYSDFLSRCERLVDCSFGEPLTHPDFFKLAQKVAGNGQFFAFVTNGLLLTPKRSDILLEAGDNIVFSISINAATAETYHKLTGQSFDRVIGNTKYFIDKYKDKWGHNPLALGANFIVMRVNRNEVADFLRLAYSLGISRINLRHLFDMPGSRPRNDFGYEFIYRDEMLTAEEYKAIGNSAKILAQQLGINLIIHWETGSAMNDFAVPGVDIPCLFPWKYLFVQEHSKNVYMCGYSYAAVGSVKTDSLEQVWNNEIMVEVRSSLGSGKIPEFCKSHGAFCPLVLKNA